MEALEKNRYLYYLQLGDETTPVYLQLAKKFKQFNMELIPIRYSEIDVFMQTGSENLVILCQDIKQLEILNKFSKKLLNYMLSSGKVKIYLFTSFEMNDVLKKHYQRKKVIQYHLPLSLNRVVGEIISQILSSNKGANKWPGGRKSSFHQLLVKPI